MEAKCSVCQFLPTDFAEDPIKKSYGKVWTRFKRSRSLGKRIQRTMKVHSIKERLFCRESLVTILIGLWIFLIPFGKAEKGPVILLALLGLFQLIQTKGEGVPSQAAKSFLLLLVLYLGSVAISFIDAISLKAPVKVLLTGIGSGFAGFAIINTSEGAQKFLQRIWVISASVVGFWLLDAGIQAIFGKDLFGLVWEGGRLSGPWLKKTQMGYYSGPFSALLLMFALKKKWRPTFLWALFLFTSTIVLLNNSRGGWVMYGVVATIFCWRAFIKPLKYKWIACVGLVTLGAALLMGLYAVSETFKSRADQTLLALSGNTEHLNAALSERLPVWKAAWGVFRAKPIHGVGARNFRQVAPDYWPKGYVTGLTNAAYPHQFILEYGVGTGLVGLAGLAASIILCVHWWTRANPTQRTIASGFGLALLAFYFPLNSHRAYFGSEQAISLWMLITLYIVAIRSGKEVKSEV